MTYAELYGNIKKRPLKCGLGNKLIREKSSPTSILANSIKVEKITGMGDALTDLGFDNEVSPLVNLDGKVSFASDDESPTLDILANGI